MVMGLSMQSFFARRKRLLGILLILAAMLLWSTVPVGTRLLVAERTGAFSATFISAMRLWIAAIIFFVLHEFYVRKPGAPHWPRVKRPWWMFASALSLCVNYLFYAIGLRYTTAGATSVVSQVQCGATVLLAALLLGERLTWNKVTGVLLATAGVLLVMLNKTTAGDVVNAQYFTGNVIEFWAALAWPLYVIGQTKLQQAGDDDILLPIFTLAAIMMTIALPVTGPLLIGIPTINDWIVLIFLGIGSTAAAYWLFAAGLRYVEASDGTMFNILIPLLALLQAHWILHEPLHPGILFGLALTLSGLTLIVWRRSWSPLRR